MVRVLIAEDSVTIREFLVAVMDGDPEIVVVGTARNGQEAVEMTKRLRPDVVAMDISMPVMNGFEATKRIMIEAPTPIVIISATVDVREVGVSMAALNSGALALLEKPLGAHAPDFDDAIRRFLGTMKAMAGVKVVRHWRAPPAPVARAATPDIATLAVPIPKNAARIQMVGIAASTGGPAALGRLLSELPPQFPAPILVVQHITTGFIDGLVSWLNTTCALRVRVATDGEPLTPSTVFFAGDGHHLGVSRDRRIRLDAGAPIDGFRPSASHLFESAGAVYGRSMVAVVLTGMGRDGATGLRAVHAAGGRVIAQDEASSVVFGMPRAAIEAGLADAVLPLSSIGGYLRQLVGATGGADNEGG